MVTAVASSPASRAIARTTETAAADDGEQRLAELDIELKRIGASGAKNILIVDPRRVTHRDQGEAQKWAEFATIAARCRTAIFTTPSPDRWEVSSGTSSSGG
jgi:hypothetical protein